MSNAAGMLSGAFMTISLLAVPCVAVFGLPAAGGAVAEAESRDGISLGDGDLGSPPSSPAALGAAAAFAPLVDASGAAPSGDASRAAEGDAHEQSHLAPTSDRRGAVANTAVGLTDPTRTVELADEASATPENIFKTADGPAASGPSWEAAVEKLGTFGIRDFHLSNGDTAGQFYFTCSLKEAGRNFTRRFEAEGNSPVAAAEDVLAQVEECLGTR